MEKRNSKGYHEDDEGEEEEEYARLIWGTFNGWS